MCLQNMWRLGHTSRDHRNQCPNCDASHGVEECTALQVTCFLSEGTNHVPARCHLYPTVQQDKQQVRDVMRQALKDNSGQKGEGQT